jgi:DNA-binding CsgD family transcriptional regulator
VSADRPIPSKAGWSGPLPREPPPPRGTLLRLHAAATPRAAADQASPILYPPLGGRRPAPAGRRPGQGAPGVAVAEPDALLRLQVTQALARLCLGGQIWRAPAGPAAPHGLSGAPAPGVRPEHVPAADLSFVPGRLELVGLDAGAVACLPAAGRGVACGGSGGPCPTGTLRVGYAARHPELLGAHRLHRCCDQLLELRATAGGPVFVHAPPGTLVERAGLSPREADVVLLLCAGLTTNAVAARLCVSAATARSHCRSVLRKLGVHDRRALRETLLRRPD